MAYILRDVRNKYSTICANNQPRKARDFLISIARAERKSFLYIEQLGDDEAPINPISEQILLES